MKLFLSWVVFLFSLNLSMAVEKKCDSIELKNISRTVSFGESGEKLGAMATCSKVNSDGKRFSELNCRLAIECSKTMIEQTPSHLLPALFYVAEDYASLKLAEQIKKMEHLDLLIRFAATKYNNLGLVTCTSPLAYRPELTGDCNPTVMEEGFARLTKSCSKSLKNYCYGDGGLPLKEYDSFTQKDVARMDGKAETPLQNAFINYSGKRLAKTIVSDRDVLTELTDIMIANDSPDEKMQQIYTKLKDYDQRQILDPVLGSVKEQLVSFDAYKETAQFKHFKKLLQSRKWNKQTALVVFEKYRAEKTQELLKSECASTSSYYSICEDATNIIANKSVSMGPVSNASEVLSDSEDEDRFFFLKEVYPDGIKKIEDYKIIMDSQRCSKIFNKSASETDGEMPFANQIIMTSPKTDSNRPLAEFSSRDREKLLESFAQDQARFILGHSENTHGEAISRAKQEPISSVQAQPESGQIQEETSSGFVPSSVNTQYRESYNTDSGRNYSDVQPSQVATTEESPKQASVRSRSEVDEKIMELNKKLNVAEKAFEHMKTEKVEAATEKDSLQKSLENNKTIADLRKQISELSAETQKNKQEESKSIEKSDEPLVHFNERNASMARSNGGAASDLESSVANVGRSSTMSSPNNSAAVGGATTSSGALESESMPRSAMATHDSKTLVLSTLDGMSSEKATETITQKIMELEGRPFLIEVEGMVEEIVPIVKNGKVIVDEKGNPLYEKIIKGKVGDAKFLRGKSAGAIKVITDAADLKRDQEEKLKRERIQYMKLKKITRDLLNKK